MKVIKIGAIWCNGCLVMKPRWQEIETENPWLKTEYCDYDQDKNVVKLYRIESGKLPVFIFLDKDGKEIMRKNGEIEKNELVRIIKEMRNK